MKTTNTEKSLKEEMIKVICANCQKETYVHTQYGTMSEVRKWLNEHKTRIGRTYCSMDYIGFNFDSLISQAKREIAKDLDEIHASFPEDSPSQEWWEATDKLLNYIQKLKSHITEKK